MDEQRRGKLGRAAARYIERVAEGAPDDPDFDRAFQRVRDAVLRPVLEEVRAELAARGVGSHVAIDDADELPSIFLVLESTPDERCDRVGFAVIRRRAASEVLAYLVVSPPPMDLRRYAHPEELTTDHVEQLVVDAVGHVLACRASKPRR